MDYWVLGSDNIAKGPYPEQRLRAAHSEGGLRGDRQICPVGSTTWTTVAAVFGSGGSAPPPPPTRAAPSPRPPSPPPPSGALSDSAGTELQLAPAAPEATAHRHPLVPADSVIQLGAPVTAWVPMGLLWPMLCTLCCFPLGLLGGIVALSIAAHANSVGTKGDIVRATQLARMSKWWMLVTIPVGAVFNLTYVLVSLATGHR